MTIAITATYSPEDNKLRIYASSRLDSATYERVKAAGFKWAPKQELFVAPMWTPSREDLCSELAGEIEDEDTSLVERAEAKAERLEDLSERRAQEGQQARAAVDAIADGIPFGQPILIGHHSERHARKDAERIENGMRKAVDCWKAAEYWKSRATGALRLAKYKERPDVRARRIKGLEAEIRQMQSKYTPIYEKPIMQQRWNSDRDAEKIPHVFCGPKGGRGGSWVPVEDLPSLKTYYSRWIEHTENRIAYERAMLDDSGGLVAEQHDIKAGGRVLVRGEWVVVLRVTKKAGKVCSMRTAQRYCSLVSAEEVRGYEPPTADQAAKVADAMKIGPLCNYPGEKIATCTEETWKKIGSGYKGSITIAATETTGTHRIRQAIGHYLTIPDAAKTSDSYWRHSYYPVYIVDAKRKDPPAKTPTPASEPEPEVSFFAPIHDPDDLEERTARLTRSNQAQEARQAAAAPFIALQEQLKAGVKVVAAPQLFPTPSELAARMVEEADISPEHRILEPSAGTGNILTAIRARDRESLFDAAGEVVAVELNPGLAQHLTIRFSGATVIQGDFLEQNGNLGTFDRILMNPPFEHGADIKHIQHAIHALNPGGRLVAICANGPRQQATLKAMAETSGGWYEELPAGTFADQGSNVNTALLVIEN